MNRHRAVVALAILITGVLWIQAYAQQSPVSSVPYIEIVRPEWEYINDIAFSPDGQHIIVAADTGLWLLDEQLQILDQLHGHSGSVYAVSWNTAGTLLATGGEDHTIRLWDLVETSPSYLSEVQTLHDTGPVYFVAWSPDAASNQLATRTVTRREASSDSLFVETAVRIWNSQSGQVERTLGSFAYGAREVAWSPDGVRLAGAGATAGQGYRLFVWNAQTGDLIARSSPQLDQIRSVAWRPNSSLAAYADETGLTTLFDPDAAYPTSMLGWARGTTQIRSLAWNPDGSQFALGTAVNYLLVYDANTDQVVVQMDNSPYSLSRVQWSADGGSIAAVSGNDGIRVFDVRHLPVVSGVPTITPYPLPLSDG